MATLQTLNNASADGSLERRVLIAAPTGGDAGVVADLLADIDAAAVVVDSLSALCAQIELGAAAAVIAEELLVGSQEELAATLGRQPEWSDFPLIVMIAANAEHRRWPWLDKLSELTHAVLLQRPVRKATLISCVQAALRSRDRQYQVRDELATRRQAEHALRESEQQYRQLVGLLPVALYTCEAPSGLITFYNDQAATLWGRSPKIGDTDARFCGSFKLWRPDGTLLPHEETPMAQALREGLSFRNEHVDIERPDGTRISVLVNIDPIRDAAGRVVGAINAFHDMTELWRTQQALRDSEERFRELANNIDQFAWTCNELGKAIWYNQRWLDYTGTTLSEMQDAGWKKVHHPDHVDRVVEKVKRHAETGEPWEDVFPLRGKDGKYRWFLSRAAPIRDEQGNIIRWFGTNTDVTKEREAEAKLAAKEAELELIANTTPLVLTRCSRDLRYLFANETAARFCGMTVQQMVGKPIAEVLGERAFAQIKPHIDRVLSGETVEFEAEMPYGGGTRWVHANYVPERDAAGNVTGWIASIADITERKHAEQALRRSEEQLAIEVKSLTDLHALSSRLLMASDINAVANDTLDALIDMLDADMGTLQYYDRAEQGLRYVTQRGFDQKTLDCLPVVHGDFHSTCAQALASGQRVIVEDFETDPAAAAHRETAAKLGYRAAQSTPLVAASGRIAGIVTTHFRQPRRFEARELRLIDLTVQRTGSLMERARIEQALRDADRRKNEFLATLAHELRNPLAPIRTGLELIKRIDNDPAALEEVRGTMERQMQQLVTLVDDLLDVSRITRGKLELRCCRVSLSDVVRSAVEATQPLIDEQNHTLTVNLPAEPVLMHADPNRLAQVFSNLLNNAAKYTPEYGRITLAAERWGDEVVVRVTDTGIGIDRGAQQRIFEMFTQIDHPAERGHSGLGIGLTLVKSLVEMHNGRIEVESEGLNRGSTFTVCLPVLACEATDGSPHRAAPRNDGIAAGKRASGSDGVGSDGDGDPPRKRRVLVVDDNQAAVLMLSRIVKMLGYEVRTASDGQEGVELAEAFLPEVVLMDLGMPRMNGYEAASHIRQQPWGKDMTLIALTGWGQDEAKQRTTEAGFNHHLVKPAEPDELQRLLAMTECAT